MQKTVHDRKAREINRQAEVTTIEVDDPYEAGEKIIVTRQLRNDPLARLHDHHQIDDAQYLAGRAYQRDWETAERGARAIDPTKEAVDGGKMPEPITDSQAKARKRLIQVRVVLGVRMHQVAHAVLIDGQSLEKLALIAFNKRSESWFLYYGRMFRDALDLLAVEYSLASPRKILPFGQISR
jgi:hypothetical protein